MTYTNDANGKNQLSKTYPKTPRPAQPTPGPGPPDLTQRISPVADLHHLFELEVLDAARRGGQAEDGVLRLGVQDQAGRIRPWDRSRR